ncbi:hypothetical protein GOBAR_AA02399 [Gossypium barbadense]|uniref:Uncharacterized protein n=1 Tax=Gossypium barbadense TaxID=3634 RepID=A0A2P5YRE8_GOSBA|nr:hypothetical protein GOBAR_AA02399 [Gossypium barbadense]
MAPEYALDGLFSVKSNVFSFGIMMHSAEKRNMRFYQVEDDAPSLVGYEDLSERSTMGDVVLILGGIQVIDWVLRYFPIGFGHLLRRR